MNTHREQLKRALAKGFYGDNLLYMALLVSEVRRTGELTNPVAFFVVEQVLRRVHAHWFEQQPTTVQLAGALEDRLTKLLEATLTDGDPQALLAHMNELVEEYDACRREVAAPIESPR